MKPQDNIENQIKKIRYKPSAETHNRILNNVLQALDESEKTTSAHRPNFWRIIMKTKIAKLTAVAVIIIAAVVSITIFDKSVTPAYAIEQTIEANHSVRYLHVKGFGPLQDEPMQSWCEFDESGQTKNVRLDFPEWAGGLDGAKVVVWKENTVQIRFKKKNSLVNMRDKTVAAQFLELAENCDPKLAVQRLYEKQEQGKVKLEIEEPSDKAEPIIITATPLEEYALPFHRMVLSVDQATKLVASVELYQFKGGKFEQIMTLEFHDYNKPIEAKMFTLDDVPADVARVDWTTEEIGMPQGELSDKEIAVKIVREFYEAIIAKDYAKAGRLYSNMPADRIRERWAEFGVLRIISISEPIPHPTPGVGGFQVHCKIEIEKDGVKSVYEPYGPGVRPVHGQPERWNIHGGVK
ncbi:hypothetical protein ACFL1G_11715 [Planctomycetota bacterium]